MNAAADLGELRQPVVDALLGAGGRLIEGASPEAVARADLGVSAAAPAIAETGSIVVAGSDFLPRLATMLPLIHVVLVDPRRIVPSLDEADEFVRRVTLGEDGEAARCVTFVSGPSRTADIEKTLSTGVHGPRELHLVLVRAGLGRPGDQPT